MHHYTTHTHARFFVSQSRVMVNYELLLLLLLKKGKMVLSSLGLADFL
jgi:hypothetical protein